MVIQIRDVFKSLGQPTTTYVERENGKYEKAISIAINSKGKICLLTGPSKTGKTTLYKEVLANLKLTPLVVRCDNEVSSADFWKKALETLDFERITSSNQSQNNETTANGKVGGKIGWAWLAGLIGEVSLGVKRTMEEVEIREKVLSQPSPSHLIPALKELPIFLVVEDFHYLTEETQKNIFQQWKVFSDNEVSVLIVGTTHHAIDLAYANRDLIGRISQIDLNIWKKIDLKNIVIQGFNYIGIEVKDTITNIIAKESAGLPIIVQDACSQLFYDKEIITIKKGTTVNFTTQNVYLALHHVAKNNYAQFEQIHERIKIGPRKRSRKYDTYELVLSLFVQNPITAKLKRHQIDERLDKLNIKEGKRPPLASINSMLKALSKFQIQIGIELLYITT